jgi:hypothetical protein
VFCLRSGIWRFEKQSSWLGTLTSFQAAFNPSIYEISSRNHEIRRQKFTKTSIKSCKIYSCTSHTRQKRHVLGGGLSSLRHLVALWLCIKHRLGKTILQEKLPPSTLVSDCLAPLSTQSQSSRCLSQEWPRNKYRGKSPPWSYLLVLCTKPSKRELDSRNGIIISVKYIFPSPPIFRSTSPSRTY